MLRPILSRPWRSAPASLLLLLALLSPDTAEAARPPITTFTWDGGGGNSNWTTAANWVGDVAPTGVATDHLVFATSIAVLPVNNFAVGTTIGSISFTVGGFTVSGNSLAIVDGITGSAGVNTMTLPIVLTADATIDMSAGASLNLNGAISGAFGLTKTGPGTVTFRGANSYTGSTTIDEGVLAVGVNNALGTVGAGTVVTSGGTLAVTENVNYTTPEPLSIIGTGQGDLGALASIGNISQINTFSGPVTLTGDCTIGAETFKVLILGGPVDMTLAGHALTFQVKDSTGITLNGVLSGSGPVIKTAPGTLTLAAANSFTGSTTITEGAVQVTANDALGSTAAGTTVASGGWIYLSGNVNYSSPEPVTLNGGRISNLSGVNAFSAPVTMTAASQISANNDSLTLTAPIDNGGFALTVFVNTSTTVTVDSVISNSGSLAKTGLGTLVLNAANTMLGSTTLQGVLVVNGSLPGSVSAAGGGSLTRVAGLGGSMGAVTVSSATLAPGPAASGAGLLNTGSLSLGATATFEVQLNGATPGAQHDQVNVVGTISLGGATLSPSLGFAPSGQVFTIINNDGADPVTGTFNGLADGASIAIGAGNFIVDYDGGDGNDVTLTNIPAFVWDGGGADNNWMTATNWVGDVAPTGLPGETLVFAGSTRLTPQNNYPPGTDFGAIAFTAGGFVVGGNAIRLNGNLTTSAASNTITLPMELALNITISHSTGVFTVNGPLSGPFGVTKSGAGYLVIGGNNSYAGVTTISAGTLSAAANNALGSAAAGTIVASGTTLEISGGVNYTTPEPVSISGSGPFGTGSAIRNFNGNNTFAGPVTLAANATIGTSGGGSTFTLSGPIHLGSFNLTMGTGWTVLAGAIDGPGDLIIAGGAKLAATNTYTGMTSVQGVLEVSADGALGPASAGTVLTFPATLNFSGGVTYTTPEPVTVIGPGSGGGSGAIGSIGGDNSFSGPILLSGDADIRASAGSLTVSGAINNGGFLLRFATEGGAIEAEGAISGAGGLVKVGPGILTLSGVNSYQGTTTISVGTLVASADNALGAAAAGTSIAFGSVLAFDGNIAYTAAEPVTSSGGRISNLALNNSFAGSVTCAGSATLESVSGSLSLTGPFDSGSSNVTLSGSGDLTIDGVISNNGDITKTGTGLLTLGGANTFTGSLVISAGVLRITADGALGSTADGTNILNGTALELASGLVYTAGESVGIRGTGIGGTGALRTGPGIAPGTFAGTLRVNGGPATFAATGCPLVLSGNVDLNNQSLTFDGGGPIQVSGPLIGNGSIIKSGAGSLSLDGLSSATGSVTANAGSLAVNGTLNIPFTVNSGATLAGAAGTTGNVTTTAGGILNPGLLPAGTGILNCKNLSLAAGSAADFHINGAAAGSGHDQVSVTGTVNLGGATLSIIATYFAAGSFTLIANDGVDAVVGTFNGLPEGASFSQGGATYHISYGGGSGNDVVLTNTPKIEWSVASQAAAEGAGTMTVTASLSEIYGIDVTLPYSLSGTATDPSDYTITASPILIPAGTLTGSATITILEDGAAETDETVVLTMGTPVNATAGAISVHTATILDNEPPVVLEVSSLTPDGTYGTGQAVAVTIGFTRSVIVTGTPQLTLETGSTNAVVNYSGGSGSAILQFNYTAATGHQSPDLDYVSPASLALNGGSIKDAGGMDALLTLATPGTGGSLGAAKNIVIANSYPPSTPTLLLQFKCDGRTALNVGGLTREQDVILEGVAVDPDAGQRAKLQVELRPTGVAFTNLVMAESDWGPSGSRLRLSGRGLLNSSNRWQARVVDELGVPSPWVSFGGNADPADPDFFKVALPPIQIGVPVVSDLRQYRPGGVFPLGTGATAGESTLVFKGNVSIPSGGLVRMWVDVQPVGIDFGAMPANPPNQSAYVPSGAEAVVTIPGIPDGPYHWRALALGADGGISASVVFGGNADPGDADFILDTATGLPPALPTNLTQHDDVDSPGASVGYSDNDGGLAFKGRLDHPSPTQSVSLQVEVRAIGTPFSNLASVESAPVAPGSVATAHLSLLPDGDFHWQARTIDSTGLGSAWSSFGGNGDPGGRDFEVDSSSNSPPALTGALGQFKSDASTAISVGQQTNEPIVTFGGTGTDPQGDRYRIQIEIRTVATAFQGIPTAEGPLEDSGSPTMIAVGGISNGSSYHWRARVVDEGGSASGWTSFGGNADGQSDFAASSASNSAPSLLPPAQFRLNGSTAIAAGGTTNESSVIIQATVDSGDAGQLVRLRVEARPQATPFGGGMTVSSGWVETGSAASAVISGLVDGTDYHWQAWAEDTSGAVSALAPFPPGDPDFTKTPNTAPGAPTAEAQFRVNGVTVIAVGGVTPESGALLAGVVTDPGDPVRIQVEIQPVGTDFTGVPSAAGSVVPSGMVSQALVTGLASPTGYHWQLRSIDSSGDASAWVAFGGNPDPAGIDFRVDTTYSDPVPDDDDDDKCGSIGIDLMVPLALLWLGRRIGRKAYTSKSTRRDSCHPGKGGAVSTRMTG